ncbi:hypothetical protein ABG768_002312, partial [Culter alburnus]
MMGIIRKLMVLGPHGMAAISRSRWSRHSSVGPVAVHRMGKSRQNGADTGMEGAVASSQHQETGELKAIPQE